MRCRSRGGISTKLHLRAGGGGRPITAVLTGGERNEQIALEAIRPRRSGQLCWPRDHPDFREALKRAGAADAVDPGLHLGGIDQPAGGD